MKKFMTASASLVIAFVLSCGPASAVELTVKPSGFIYNSCYTPADAEAEQAVRIRSELMVIGLNCQASRFRGTDENLYAVYREFISEHGPQFATYESQMINYFVRAGLPDPESGLNAMSTAFGNKIALYVTQLRPDMFCYQYSRSLIKVKGMSADAFHQWAVSSAATHPPTHPLCSAQQTIVAPVEGSAPTAVPASEAVLPAAAPGDTSVPSPASAPQPEQ